MQPRLRDQSEVVFQNHFRQQAKVIEFGLSGVGVFRISITVGFAVRLCVPSSFNARLRMRDRRTGASRRRSYREFDISFHLSRFSIFKKRMLYKYKQSKSTETIVPRIHDIMQGTKMHSSKQIGNRSERLRPLHPSYDWKRTSVEPTSMSTLSVSRIFKVTIDVKLCLPPSKQPNPQKYHKHQTQKYHKRKPSNPLSLRHPLHPSHRPTQINLCSRKILILKVNIPTPPTSGTIVSINPDESRISSPIFTVT